MKSPRARVGSNNRNNREAAMMLSSEPFDPDLLVPFPDLPCSVLPRNENQPQMAKKRRHHDHAVPTNPSSIVKESMPSSMSQPATATTATTSAPISLPNSHIHRTPSELRLETLTLRAEHEDVRMYSRLLGGMQDQIRHRRFASGDDDVHHLSMKSMRGIVTTKLANDQDLEEQQEHNPYGDSADDDGWDLSYIPVGEENENTSSVETPLLSSKGLKYSMSKLIPDTEKGGQEDDCVFSMEL